MPAPIKLSIITVNLNNANGLSKTLESVASQTFTDYEHIIIDGGSTDGSVAIIKEYEQKYNGVPGHLYWVSEPDKGIYNAMNKGIKVASGEYCLFLNSGDWLVKNACIRNALDQGSIIKEDIIYGKSQTNKGELTYPKALDLAFFAKGTIAHQSTFIKTSLFKEIGYYDESLKIVSDWKFWMQAIVIHQCSHRYIPEIISFFEYGGISSHHNYVQLQKEERNKILNELFNLQEFHFENIIQRMHLLDYYENSRLVQIFKRLQTNKLYTMIRRID